MEDFILTEQMLANIKEQDEWMKHDLGRYDIEKCLVDSENFDRRKFGKLECPFCNHKFNPYYHKSLKQGQWDWVWQGDSHKEPESNCEMNCPKCNENLRFTQYIGQ